jgi:hypothetical protein
MLAHPDAWPMARERANVPIPVSGGACACKCVSTPGISPPALLTTGLTTRAASRYHANHHGAFSFTGSLSTTLAFARYSSCAVDALGTAHRGRHDDGPSVRHGRLCLRDAARRYGKRGDECVHHGWFDERFVPRNGTVFDRSPALRQTLRAGCFRAYQRSFAIGSFRLVDGVTRRINGMHHAYTNGHRL